MLSEFNNMTNIAVKDLEESKKFYQDTLGLKIVKEHDFGTTYTSGNSGGILFVYPAPTAGTSKATIATWEVSGIKDLTEKLAGAGVKFEHYEFPGVEYDGDIHIMGGMSAAWFRDPSGNILGLNEGSND